MRDNTLTVATVLKPQGIRGEIKVKVFMDDADDLKGFSRLFVGGVEYSVMSVRGSGEFAYLVLRGIADRNAAELLRGKSIEVARGEAPELPEGRYYIVDLIGCEVLTERGDLIGEVTDVTPAKTDVYTISKNGKETVFAAADCVIADVDVGAKKITVNSKRFKEVSL